MNLSGWKVTRTRFEPLGFGCVESGCWRFVDMFDSSPGSLPSFVGPFYGSKDELLADVERYADGWGCA